MILTISTLIRKKRLPCYALNRLAAQLIFIALISGCASDAPKPLSSERANQGYKAKPAYNRPYKVKGKTYYPLASATGYRKRGIASWYGAESGGKTAMGSRFKPAQLTAAHKTLPLPCKIKVTNLNNGRSIEVLVNDRGPFHGGRLIDLSQGAAKKLGIKGLTEVEVEYVEN
ncbi:MAG: septal ring lytic transglycosylase RlpA family protein [Methylococcaceae bacterium]|nr:septal ring lytic transglycosylase RlpA family protein [Methylococcaceae bacterium]